MSQAVLLSKPGCRLCDEMQAVALPVLEEHGHGLVVRDVREDPEDRRRYALDIPVLLLDGVELCRHRVSAEQLRARLRALAL